MHLSQVNPVRKDGALNPTTLSEKGSGFYSSQPPKGAGLSNGVKDFFRLFKISRWPSKNQWKRFFKVLNKKEKFIFSLLLISFLGSAFYLLVIFYLKNTELKPDFGGTYIEGVIGQPRFINPVYSRNSDIDQGLVELLFSGLMKHNHEGGVVPDLAESYKIEEEGKVYEVYLKKNLFWSDGSPLTADDVIFTITTIQGSDYKSPVRGSWIGVEVEKISDLGIRFRLKNPYSSFLENLTQKIIPKKIWKDILPQSFPLALYNLKPIGSGPYKLKGLKQDKIGKIVSLDLVRNPKYQGEIPYLSQISFRFFDGEASLIEAYKNKEINGFSLSSPTNYSYLLNSVNFYSLSLPRYFAVFFNPDKSKILADKNVRQALNYGTNKEELLEKALAGQGIIVDSPILPEFYGFKSPSNVYQFNIQKAKELLDGAGFLEKEPGIRVKTTEKDPAFQFKVDFQEGSKGKDVESLQKCLAKDSEVYPEGQITGDFGSLTKQAVIRFQEKYSKDILEPAGLKQGTGIVSKTTRAKLNELCFPGLQEFIRLKISLVTVQQPLLVDVANILKDQWKSLGVEVEIKSFDISQLEKEVVKPRNYEGLLFGEVLGAIPDPFPFWHSSQKKDPGLNLALYENKNVDKILEQARQSLDENFRREKYQEFQEILIEEAPALFLYSPNYIYLVSKKIKGVNLKIAADPSKRFTQVIDWHIETKRCWK